MNGVITVCKYLVALEDIRSEIVEYNVMHQGGNMTQTRAYKRTCRVFIDGKYGRSGKGRYIKHPNYAESPSHYIRAFHVIQKDLQTLFDYVEPSDQNVNTHSFRIHELLMRVCVEVEANCTAILKENGYQRTDGKNWTMWDYKKIEQSHFLSKYRVMIPNWHGQSGIRTPFENWANGQRLDWYQTYNNTKHDRHGNFHEATLNALIDAICGLCALISAQFWTYSFSSSDDLLSVSSSMDDGFESAIGDFFRIEFPTDIPEEFKYDFNADDIDMSQDIFEQFQYR